MSTIIDTAAAIDCFRAAFDRLDDASPVHPLRRAALESFEALGVPTRRHEDWKYTDVRSIGTTPFVPATGETVDANVLNAHRLAETEADHVVFINGRLSPEHSDIGSLPEGVHVGGLAHLAATDFPLLEPHLGALAPVEKHAFIALNTGLFEDGLALIIPAETALPRPVHAIFLTTTGVEPVMNHVRNVIVAGPGSQATIIETYATAGDGVHFTTAATELHAGANATIDHYKVERECEQALHIGALAVRQDRDSNVTSHNFTTGGGTVRNDLFAALDAAGCHSTFNGLSITRNEQHVDNHLWIDHNQPHCNSWEFYKSVLDDKSSGVFSGRIYVAPGAQKTDAKQTSMNLLLTDDAHADTKPQLEIFADDVKCTHGATIGQLDEGQLFYLRCRGIGPEAARSLLIYAFANEVIEEVRIPELRLRLERLLLGRLPDSDLLRSLR